MSRNATAEQREEAVALAQEHGVTEAAKRTGWSKGSVSIWAKRAGVKTVQSEKTKAATLAASEKRQLLRETIRTKLLEKAEDMLSRMDEAHVEFKGNTAKQVEYSKAPSDACQRYATSAAILLDKFRLEVGEATGRHEVRTTDALDREIAQLMEKVGK